MNKLGTFHDNVLDLPYDLYSINLGKFTKSIENNYNYSLSEIHQLNEELKVVKGDKGYLLHTSYGEMYREFEMKKLGIGHPGRDVEVYKEVLSNTFPALEEGSFSKAQNQIFGTFAYEMYPLSVSLKSGTLENGELELIDGYRRIFFMNPKPDIDVFVKVYPELNDRQWVNAMVMFNSWKFANISKMSYFFDRGIKLGLYRRYNFHWNTIYHFKYTNIDKLMNIYTNHEPYTSLWDNDQLKDDLLLLKELLVYKPHFIDTSKRKVVEFNYSIMSNEEYTKAYPFFMAEFIENVAARLGDFRRHELQKIKTGEITERKTITFTDIDIVLKKEELQSEFVRMCKMSVWGHIQNRFGEFINPTLQEVIFN